MEAINRAWFLALNAPAGLDGLALSAALAACRGPIFLVGLLYAIAWVQGATAQRTVLLGRAVAEAEGIDAVFQEAAFAHRRIDLTEKVLKALADHAYT